MAGAGYRIDKPGARDGTVDRAPGLSVRLKLTLSYAGFLMVAGALLLAAVWVFLLRYVPDGAFLVNPEVPPTACFPSGPTSCTCSLRGQPSYWRSCWCSAWWEGGFSPAACSPPWPASRRHAHGRDRIALHRIQLPGRSDEFREENRNSSISMKAIHRASVRCRLRQSVYAESCPGSCGHRVTVTRPESSQAQAQTANRPH